MTESGEGKATEILVVGAGPVGLAMAAELARYGVSVRIIDRAAARTDKSKALVLWSRTLELFDRMGCGDAFVAAGQQIVGVNIVNREKRVAHVSLDGMVTSHPYALMLPQSETERLLAEHLSGLGVAIERGVELIDFSAAADGATATLRRPDGQEETLRTAWLIGCDGAHSTIRHRLGMAFEGDTLPSEWLLADVHVEGLPTAPGEMDMYWHAEGVLATFPIGPDHYRVIADAGLTPSGPHRPDPTLAEVQAIVDQRGPGGVTVSDPVWLAWFRINERKVADYRAGRVFLAGDAAHVHSPAGGQGMNTGIQDACNLAWKLALICRGTAVDDTLLDSYSTERSEIGRQVLAATGRATTLAVLKGGLLQSLRNHAASLLLGFAPVQHAMAETLTELSVGYPRSPLTGITARPAHGPAAGSRAVVRVGDVPFGAGSAPRFAICADPDDDGIAELLAGYSDLLEPTVRAPFGDDRIWLVRPDGYVAMVVDSAKAAEIGPYLDRIRS